MATKASYPTSQTPRIGNQCWRISERFSYLLSTKSKSNWQFLTFSVVNNFYWSDWYFEFSGCLAFESSQYWKQMKSVIVKSSFRNVLDMNSNLGGFAASLRENDVWVMNVVPSNSSKLKIIYDRGLIGALHDWYFFVYYDAQISAWFIHKAFLHSINEVV